MTSGTRWTTKDLLTLETEEGKRYEIIDGELLVSTQPHWNHQGISDQLVILLGNWSNQTNLGKVRAAPGIIFTADDNVAPDVVWISKARLAVGLEADGKLHIAPELVVEILSPGSANERRDRELKLALYSRQGVSEYWIVSWPEREIEVYRYSPASQQLELMQTLAHTDTLQSPLLPGFSCEVGAIFMDLI